MSDNSTYVSELAAALQRLVAELTRATRTSLGNGGVDITPDQYMVLNVLAGRADLATQVQLADELGREKTVVLRQIDSLEQKGLLERIADSQDRRRRGLVLTDEGRRVHAVAKTIIDQLLAKLAGDLPAEELRGVIKFLDEMRAKTRSL
ncbi:MarR family winged helix-turn-helix transcriptional regulator [Saccharothrix sp. ALI-22-I]|uniref:MarR family winged helix-turn-helix transcriptional regulator n=1 Tax=Saccharothrix sp. ALI-22-I TaxID=1933778 RepID=UPI0015C32DF5|nr:MarR family transcriptional regulator [Saccharothrix sp. ALI-22-I]